MRKEIGKYNNKERHSLNGNSKEGVLIFDSS